jgi:FKBP-type peptidyl-prolyl cis-trans isomerase FklB
MNARISSVSSPLAIAVLTALLAAGAGAAWCVPSMAASPALVSAPAPSAPKTSPPPAPDVGSYDIGLLMGGQIEHSGLAPVLSMDPFMRGLKDALSGTHAATAQEREAAVQFMHSAREVLIERNHTAAREFLNKNANQAGVVTMPSGLQYRVIAQGDPKGKPPVPTDQVTVRYRASLTDGTEFDRSDTHDRPASFRVNSVFKGWQEAFAQMKPGAKWQLFVPPDLGYGNNSPPAVPPCALIIYELELVRIEPPEAAPFPHPGAGGAKPPAGATGSH